MTNDVLIIVTLSLLIWVAPFIAKIVKLPTTPVEIILGSVASAFGFLGHGDNELFDLVAEFGFLYLMFVAGLEVNVKKLLKTDTKILRAGFAYLTILYALSILVAYQLGMSFVFMVIFPLISVGLIAALSKEYGKETPWIKISLTIGILGELISIIVLTLASAGIQYGIGIEFFTKITTLAIFIGSLALLYYLLHLIFWWYPEIRNVMMPYFDTKEQDIRLSMATLFIMLAIMIFLGLETAFGAFIAGVFIATFFAHKEDLETKLSSFGFGFLVPIFFIHVGSSLPIEAFEKEGLVLLAFIIAGIMLFVRLMASFAFINYFGVKNSALVGLSHAMPLTLLIAVATLAYHAKSIDRFNYEAFILASLMEVIIAMVSIKLLAKESSFQKSKYQK
ncbi:cation:proton antiporter [Hydrogenimonas thermophila]|uniref:Transporter, CPA2 family n=1 Tax=Hydrogenimonas thermophila TaxID=223786 RepID=A0A1I5L6S2_9BACT|nr:cation:proton antiporter [Hydrogenimonas thermophila]WOE70063.1 cation:proton antiporter [Hydrogenimonas thermophila]WOE72580.1 cation:proton antiporter [Hydrogenimonas thermophila]SFO92576.1 transporter, CPA2 family [Hydrogenimonas thermophila]